MKLNAFLMALATTWLMASALCGEPTGLDAVKLMGQGKVNEALAIFEKLAEAGDTRAMVELGNTYYRGEAVKQDYQKAMDWYLKALGKQDADAFVNLGIMHRDGNGVAPNKKIAYCVFLTTHMCGLGSESTVIRANNGLRKLMEELTREDIKDCLSNYTVKYVIAYLESKGKLEGIPDEFKPSQEIPALRDTGWFMDEEIDALYGPPTEEVKTARKERDKQHERKLADSKHLLIVQIRFSGDTANQYESYEIITDQGMSGGPIVAKKMTKVENDTVFELNYTIYAEAHRHLTIEDKKQQPLIYEIKHPVKSAPCDWSQWQKPIYALKDGMDTFSILHGQDPKSKTDQLPADAPEIRFKVIKE